MPIFKKIIFLSLTIILTNCSDILTHKFANSTELLKSKVYQNGWITMDIPYSAYKEHQASLMHHWEEDIRRHELYKEIAIGILDGLK